MSTLDENTTKELARIGAETSEGLTSLEGLKIDTAQEMESYSDLLADVVARRKTLEEIKKTATRPMTEALNAVRGWFAPAEKAAADLEALIKGAITDYRIRAGELAASARESLKAAGSTGEATAALETIAEAEKAEGGSTTTRKAWGYTIAIDAEIPREFLMVDEAKIKAAIKSGVREIPGLIIHQVSTTVMKRKPRTPPAA